MPISILLTAGLALASEPVPEAAPGTCELDARISDLHEQNRRLEESTGFYDNLDNPFQLQPPARMEPGDPEPDPADPCRARLRRLRGHEQHNATLTELAELQARFDPNDPAYGEANVTRLANAHAERHGLEAFVLCDPLPCVVTLLARDDNALKLELHERSPTERSTYGRRFAEQSGIRLQLVSDGVVRALGRTAVLVATPMPLTEAEKRRARDEGSSMTPYSQAADTP